MTIMMIPSELQRQKSAEVFAEVLERDQVLPSKIMLFRKFLAAALAEDVNIFGYYSAPDKYLKIALRKSKLGFDTITDVIVVAFAGGDKIQYFRDGEWHSR